MRCKYCFTLIDWRKVSQSSKARWRATSGSFVCPNHPGPHEPDLSELAVRRMLDA